MDVSSGTTPVKRRDGAATRKEAQRLALQLFSTQGYEATSMRQIGDALGINKASLYYHFSSKEAILRSLFEERGSEAEDLVSWVVDQPTTPDRLERAVLRWVDSFSADKLRGIRFLRANPLIARVLDATESERVTGPLQRFVDILAVTLPDPSAERVLLLRMSILSINAAVEAAAGTEIPDDAIVAAAHHAALALLRALGEGGPSQVRPTAAAAGRASSPVVPR
jgi:AcrR family transcriptional regulator